MSQVRKGAKLSSVLVVDDNPVNLKLIGEVLEFEGYAVLFAHDAEAAQLIITDLVPDLILMDIALPGIDGLTLTRLLKADERTRRTPIVALTAFAMKGDAEKAQLAGCDAYLTKPIDTRKLPQQVAQWIEGAHLNSANQGVTPP